VDGFDDPCPDRESWNRLVAGGDTDMVFLTWEFQRAWWEAFAWGRPIFVVAERDGELVALAPFVADEHSICLVGDEEAEWLDFVGDLSDDATVVALVAAARKAAPASANFDLRNLPGWHPRLRQLEAAASALGLGDCYSLSKPTTPILNLAELPRESLAMAAQKALREDRWLRKNGELVVEQLRDADEILPHLDDFFDQHVARWADVEGGYSVFAEPESRVFVKHLTRLMSAPGWLRFTRLIWNGRTIAYDYNLCYRGRFHMWRSSFAADLARRSPGAVMTRYVVREAIDEGAAVLDWGPGDVPYKLETATRIENACWWGTEAA
jgi:CelD/BcsL family acetyltransferase involved in cellulose biosynthesis